MATLTLRTAKGSELTYEEGDANWTASLFEYESFGSADVPNVASPGSTLKTTTIPANTLMDGSRLWVHYSYDFEAAGAPMVRSTIEIPDVESLSKTITDGPEDGNVFFSRTVKKVGTSYYLYDELQELATPIDVTAANDVNLLGFKEDAGDTGTVSNFSVKVFKP